MGTKVSQGTQTGLLRSLFENNRRGTKENLFTTTRQQLDKSFVMLVLLEWLLMAKSIYHPRPKVGGEDTVIISIHPTVIQFQKSRAFSLHAKGHHLQFGSGSKSIWCKLVSLWLIPRDRDSGWGLSCSCNQRGPMSSDCESAEYQKDNAYSICTFSHENGVGKYEAQ